SSIIRQYTREAGVRNLERTVATVCRKVARKIIERRTAETVTAADAKAVEAKVAKSGKVATTAAVKPAPIVVDAPDLEEMLGPPKYTVSKAEEQNEVGLTNGLAYTDAGGDMLQI